MEFGCEETQNCLIWTLVQIHHFGVWVHLPASLYLEVFSAESSKLVVLGVRLAEAQPRALEEGKRAITMTSDAEIV